MGRAKGWNHIYRRFHFPTDPRNSGWNVNRQIVFRLFQCKISGSNRTSYRKGNPADPNGMVQTEILVQLVKPIFKNSFRLWRDSISVNGTDSMNSKRDSGMKFTIWPNSDLTGFPTSLESAPSPLLPFSFPFPPSLTRFLSSSQPNLLLTQIGLGGGYLAQ